MAKYTEKLRDPRWQKKRLQILERDGFCCTLCHDTETTLAVHHKKYFGQPWECPDEHLITVCQHCHFILSHLDVAALGAPFNQCVKRKFKDGYNMFFCTEDNVIIASIKRGEFVTLEIFPNDSFRDVIQTVINMWLYLGNEHLLIDQSPVLTP